MQRIIIETPDSLSAILVGARWEAVTKLLPQGDVVIVTDANLFNLYGNRFPRFPVLKLKPGEDSKKLPVIQKLTTEMLRLGFDRTVFILAIGGGVVCDVAGFLASVYMRGVRCGYISTSLLAQVDASTGGKTGVNLGRIKNVIGTFRQPEFVICDTTMLRTLPDTEYMSGLAELIKTGLIGDRSIIDILENNQAAVLGRDRELLTDLVARSVRFKASVVAKDEKEGGIRRILNFGHTFGHAIELHQSVPHGFAVAAGMEIAARFSLEKKYIGVKVYDRIIRLLRQYGFHGEFKVTPRRVRELISHDKKKSGDMISFVFLKGIGKAEVKKLPVDEIVGFYSNFRDL
ncbi:MAG: 3-dehydroquinate synthase [Bacteroidales bacterium]|nr:3-dehydroquinate synthase [Bacteroidales bacterium]MBN2632579.1 3-dehydroquinate synthase [Bacteroidales bacterium]